VLSRKKISRSITGLLRVTEVEVSAAVFGEVLEGLTRRGQGSLTGERG
jgi:hypothetical protein